MDSRMLLFFAVFGKFVRMSRRRVVFVSDWHRFFIFFKTRLYKRRRVVGERSCFAWFVQWFWVEDSW